MDGFINILPKDYHSNIKMINKHGDISIVAASKLDPIQPNAGPDVASYFEQAAKVGSRFWVMNEKLKCVYFNRVSSYQTLS